MGIDASGYPEKHYPLNRRLLSNASQKRSVAVRNGSWAMLPIGIWSGLALLDAVVWFRWLSGAMTAALPTALVWIARRCWRGHRWRR